MLVDTVPVADGEGELPSTYGRFVVLGVLGRGGMGVVLRAKDPDLDREVALKLVQPASWRTTEASLGATTIAREAQAMAKLAHPNVVAVYEMGSIGDARFIAMELVEGMTLRRWLAAAPRTWREVVTAFVSCGRGLAAAHDAGLVHRDFKPDNVLVGADGRPRVTDFGLVASGADAVRGVVGTPAYMSPEQWHGEQVDPRTDQYAFCVALWEALFGQPPFVGSTPDALRDAVLGSEPRMPPRRRGPRSLVAILRRGLARDRAQRWPSMKELLDAVDAKLARHHLVAWGAVGGGLAVAAIAITLALMPRGGACPLPTERLAGIWDDTVRGRVAEPRLRTALDDYATGWLAASAAACKASDSPALRDQRAVCLERARTALGALAHALADGSPAVVDRADAALARLPDLAACANVERLAATVPPPADPVLRARLAALDAAIEAVEGLRLHGKQPDALAAVTAVVAEAHSLAYAPALARAYNELGNVHHDARDEVAAEAAYRQAASFAADGRDDALAAEAWANVLFQAAERSDNLAGAAALDPVVDAAVRRAGDPPRLRALYLMSSGVLADHRDDLATALDRFTAAAAVTQSERDRVAAEQNIALVLWRRDGAVKAAPSSRAALAHAEALLGPDHLGTAAALHDSAQIINAAGNFAEAKGYAERALAIQARVNGADSEAAAALYLILGNIESNLHEGAAARAHLERALAIHERVKVPDSNLAITFAALASLMQYETKQLAEAVPYYQRSLELLARTSGPESFDYLMISSNLATTYQELGRCDQARPVIAKVQPGIAKLPAYYPELLTVIARCDRAGDPVRAIAEYEQALALCIEHECGFPALLRWELGALLVETKRDAARGRALVKEARTALAGDPKDATLAAIDAWLARHH